MSNGFGPKVINYTFEAMNLRSLFLRHVGQTSPGPMMTEITKAHGMWLLSAEGHRIMDLISGIGVSAVGHTHPDVVMAVQQQAALYMHTMVYGEFVLSPQVQLAHALAQNLPSPLESVYFVNSGAEAVEGALKLAKKVTGRYEIVAASSAYHGSTHATISLMSHADYKAPFMPVLPNVRYIDFNRQDHLERINTKTACVIMETVQAERGLYTPAPGYLKAVADRCREVGALFILDEIQAGMGRTGHLFGFQGYDVVPDIVLLAKGLGGGMPIGAFIASKAHMDQLADKPALGHITTFGGHPVNCAAALATLNILSGTDLISQVPVKRDRFLRQLEHPAIVEVRQAGLWLALELESSEKLQKAVRLGLKEGLLFDWFLYNDRSIRLAPPLIIKEREIDWACEKLRLVLDQLV